MKKQSKSGSVSPALRQNVEKLHEKKTFENGTNISEDEMRKLVRELQLHQIELELQNEQFRQAKDEAEVASQKYAELINFAPSAFFTLSNEGKILEVSETYCRMCGFDKQELLDMHISGLETDESAEETITHIEKVKLLGEDRFESRHRRKDGTIFDVEISLKYQPFNGGILIAFLHDITNRKKAEEDLIESEHRYHSLFEQSNDALFLLDLESGRYIDCNRLAETLTGYSREEILTLRTGAFLPPKLKPESISNIELILTRNALRKETEIVTKSGTVIPVEFNSSTVEINKKKCILSMLHDISDRRAVEDALIQSEESVRYKLQNILSPEGSIADLELKDIIDVPLIQKLLDNFHELVQIPMAIIDINGKVLVGVGWQDMCSKFHRKHPESYKNCIESDLLLTQGIPDGEFRLYKCKNNMWDIATPLIIGGEHKGNLFIGQFFFDNEPIDYDLFRKQAVYYSYTEQDYLNAIDSVPRLSRQKIEHAKLFFLNLSRSISQLSYGNIKLARAIAQQKKFEDELKEKEEFLNKAEEIAHLGSWSLDLGNNLLSWSNEMYRIFDVHPQEFPATYDGFLNSVHPEDRDAVNSAYTGSILEGKDSYEIEHRILRKNSGEIRYVLEKCEHIRDEAGKIVRSVGMTHDITELKISFEALRENERLFRESQSAAHIGSYSSDLILKTWKATTAIYEIFGIDETYPNTIDGWIRCIHPDFKEELIRDLFQKGNKNIVFEHQYKIIRFNDGAERWVHGLGKFEFDNQMNPVRLFGTIQDITKRKQAEEALNQLNAELDDRIKERTAELVTSNIALQEAEKKYRTIADYNYDWEYWHDQNNVTLYCSPACERITGYRAQEFIDNPGLTEKIIHPDDVGIYSDHKLKEWKAKDVNFEIQFRIIRSNGKISWIGHVCQPVYDALGNIIGNRGSNRDITLRKEIEEQLKTSNQKYELLSENISDGIFISREGRFAYFNKALNQIFGYSYQELEGLELIQLLLPDYQKELKNFLTLQSSFNQSRNFEVECLKNDGSVISVEILLNYVADQNMIFGVIHDITEKKQVQQSIFKTIVQTEENERAHFSKELHDGLGPLLSTIKLYLQWSERPKTNKSREEIIHKAEELLEDALTTVKEISNKLSPHLLTYYGLTPAMESFIKKLEESSAITITFASKISRRFDLKIESTIYRALIECINNTMKHARANNIFIMLDDTGSQIQVQYKDDGIGYETGEIFSAHKGMGLLNIQNRFQSIGGKINMLSKHGQGVDYQMIINV